MVSRQSLRRINFSRLRGKFSTLAVKCLRSLHFPPAKCEREHASNSNADVRLQEHHLPNFNKIWEVTPPPLRTLVEAVYTFAIVPQHYCIIWHAAVAYFAS